MFSKKGWRCFNCYWSYNYCIFRFNTVQLPNVEFRCYRIWCNSHDILFHLALFYFAFVCSENQYVACIVYLLVKCMYVNIKFFLSFYVTNTFIFNDNNTLCYRKPTWREVRKLWVQKGLELSPLSTRTRYQSCISYSWAVATWMVLKYSAPSFCLFAN